MAKEKKISVKCVPLKSKGENTYSVYYRVIYDKNSTRFPSNKNLTADSLDDAKRL